MESKIVFESLTIRDQFAMAALSAMDVQIAVGVPAAAYMANSAYLIADFMMKARDPSKCVPEQTD